MVVSERGRCLLIPAIMYSVVVDVLQGKCLFEKRFGYGVPSSREEMTSIQQVRGILQCEKICSELSNNCAAANVVFIKDNTYRCEIFAQLPADYDPDYLLPNPRGKFILHKGQYDCIL